MIAFRALATVVALLHLCFVIFVVLGGFLVLRWRWLAWIHLPAAIWGALIEFAHWTCPLTPLENLLRRRAGAAVYEGGFLDYYIFSLLYPAGLTRGWQYAIGIFVIAINAWIYTKLFAR